MPRPNCNLTSDKKIIRTYSYEEYMTLMETYSRLEVTSGNEQSEDKINTTKLNFVRMTRLNKTIVLDEKLLEVLTDLSDCQCWTVITESWCGDSAQNIPTIAKIAEASHGKINLQLVFRDDNLSFMNQYLTNGGQAIPKLIARDNSGNDLFYWGPRPAAATSLMRNWKENPKGITKNEISIKLHTWYHQNGQHDLMDEIRMSLLLIK